MHYTPFFYVIRNVQTGKYYAGSKYAKDANPDTFMTDGGYTTSSPVINKIISQSGLFVFEIVKIRKFTIGEDAHLYETRFLEKVDARNNDTFYNTHNNDLLPAYGSQKFKDYMITTYGEDNPMKIEEFIEKQRKTKMSEKWKNTTGKESIRKRIETVTSLEWKDSKGKEAIEKRLRNTDQTEKGKKISRRKKDPEWIENVGVAAQKKTVNNTDQVEKGKNISATKQSEDWKKSAGRDANIARSKTMNDDEWKNTIGKNGHKKRVESVDYSEIGKKISEKRNDPIWKENNKELCEHCMKRIPKANFARFHGDKCKHKS
jgi:hypothetical protein